MPGYSIRTHAYVLGRQEARQKLGFDTKEQDLKELLAAQAQDEVGGVESYEDLATTARDAGKDDIAQVMEDNADEEGHHAQENILALKEAARKLDDPRDDVMFYGDDSLPITARQYDLQRELGKINATALPEKQQYQRESARAGGIGGGLAGGLTGAALGHGLKGRLVGGLAGAAGGDGLGYLLGRGVGGGHYNADQALQNDSRALMQDPAAQMAMMYRAKRDRDDVISTQQRDHERALADIERERINHNIDYGGY